MAYILPSLSIPASLPSLPSADQLKRAWATAVTIVCWAVALTVTAVRLFRQLWEAVRPGLARALHSLALLLDPQLPSYPDQPEPDSEAPVRSIFDSAIDRVITASKTPVALRPAPAAKPRAARRRTTAKAAAKGAA